MFMDYTESKLTCDSCEELINTGDAYITTSNDELMCMYCVDELGALKPYVMLGKEVNIAK